MLSLPCSRHPSTFAVVPVEHAGATPAQREKVRNSQSLDFGEPDPNALPDQPCRTRTNSTHLPTSTPEQAASRLCASASLRTSQGIDTTCLYKVFAEQWINRDRQRLSAATAGAGLALRDPFPSRAGEERVLQRALFTPSCNFCTLHPAVPTKELCPKP